MQTNTDRDDPAAWFNPLAGWEAATRWNRATFDWMAKGWQQWVALVTTMPPHFVVPPTLSITKEADSVTPASSPSRITDALDSRLRGNDGLVVRAVAKAEPKRPAKPAARKNTTKKKAASRG